MGQLTPISLATGTAKGRNDVEASARLINCYAEALDQGGKSAFAVHAINGWASYATLTGASGGVRGLLSLDAELLSVAGRQLYTINAAQEVALVGGIASDGLVTMARNRQAPNPQAVIVSDGAWYVYQNGEVSIGSDPDLQSPIYVTEHNGYFVFLAANGRVTISGIDAVTIDGLDFATAQSNADGGVALATRGTNLLVFGQRSTEFWQDVGNADFPFIPQAFRGFGCYAAGSVSEMTAQISGTMVDTVIWAATDEHGASTGIYMLNGYEAAKISNYGIDRAIEADPNPENIRSFSWSENGHFFYKITGTGYTYVYDTVESVWHERKSSNLSYWNASAYESFNGKAIFGDAATGMLYRSDISLYDASSDIIDMQVILPITHAWPYELILDRLVVDAVTGVGLNSTDEHVADPQIMFDMSTDGGKNFGTVSSRSLGRIGQLNQRIEWNSLGLIPRQGTVFRFRITAGVVRSLMGIAIDVEKLAA